MDRAWSHGLIWSWYLSSYRSPCFQLGLDQCLQHLALLCRQIGHLVFVVQSEQPELHPGLPPVVNYPKPTALALVTPRVPEAQFAQPAGVRDQITGLRLLH